MRTSLQCVACGSKELRVAEVERQFPVPYGPPATYQALVHTCQNCGESGELDKRNEQRFLEAEAVAVKESVKRMLSSLAASGMNMAYLERALGLPQRTLARWKAGKASAGAVALLRMIRTFPWLAEVADESYDPVVANRKLLNAATHVFYQVESGAHQSAPTCPQLSLGPISSQGNSVSFLVNYAWSDSSHQVALTGQHTRALAGEYSGNVAPLKALICE